MSIHLAGYESHMWSFSRYTSYLRCGKGYELSRIIKAPQLPSWYAIGGNAVHGGTEQVDRLEFLMGENVTAEDDVVALTNAKLDELITEAEAKSGIDPSKWIAGGRGKEKQRSDHWHTVAPEMVQRWVDWRKEHRWEWAMFGGEPGIELRLEIELGGLPFVAVIDRLPYLPDESLAVLDIKSGQKPKTPLQLGTYATAVELAGYPRPKYGLYWMGKDGKHTEPVPLAKYTKDYLDQIFGGAIEGVRAGNFSPNEGEACRMCDVAAACYTTDGHLSHLYDRLDPNYQPNVTAEEEGKAA